jgi:hypothetical protein
MFSVGYFEGNRFARKHGLNMSQVNKLIRGDLRMFKGWRKEGTQVTPEEVTESAERTDTQRCRENGAKSTSKTSRPFVVYKDGVEYRGVNRSAFCRAHGLPVSAIAAIEKHTPSYKGFTARPS